MEDDQRRSVWSGVEAVHSAERRICGRSPVAGIGIAEGLALAGRKSATCLNPDGLTSSTQVPSGQGAWIHHAIRPSVNGSCRDMAFELVAEDVQEAIDHCLVAHRIAAALGRPGVCTLDPEVANALESVEFPGDEALAGVDRPRSRESAEELAREAFESISAATRRNRHATDAGNLEEAGFVLIGSGASAKEARRLSEALRSEGVRCGWIKLAQVHPFPAEQIRRHLEGVNEVVAVDPEWMESLSAALADVESRPRIRGLSVRDSRESFRKLGTLFDLPSEVIRRLEQRSLDGEDRCLALTALPGGSSAEKFLVDCTAPYIELEGVRFEQGGGLIERGATVQVRPSTVPGGEPRRTDLLVAGDPSLIVPDPVISSVRTEGTIVVAAVSKEQLGRGLSQEQRDAIVGRGIRLRWVDTSGLESDAVRACLQVAATGDRCWNRFLGRDPQEQPMNGLAGRIHDVDPAALGAPAELAEERAHELQMPAPAESASTGSSEAIRAFYREGTPTNGASVYPQRGLLPACTVELAQPGENDPGLLPAIGHYLEALDAERGPIRSAFVDNARRVATRLEALLDSDDSHAAGVPPGTLAASLGGASGQFVDSEALAANLPPYRGAERLDADRRDRIARVLASIRGGLERLQSEKALVVVTSGPLPGLLASDTVRAVSHRDAPSAARGIYFGLADRYKELYGAVRMGRLELLGDGTAEIHDAILSRFDWRGFSQDELWSMPQVLVYEPATRLRGPLLESLSKLLLSGLPIQVWAPERPALEPANLGRFAADHDDVFVLQASPVQSDLLIDGCRRMVRTSRPALTTVAEAVPDASVPPWTQLATLEASRSTPCFVYDIEGQGDGSPQLDLAEVRPWMPDQKVTFAHAVAVDPAFREQFLPIPVEDWREDQLDLLDYLEADAETRGGAVPFIWIAEADGTLGRAIVTRELTLAARDRKRSWETLRMWAGRGPEIDSEAIPDKEVEVGVVLPEADAEPMPQPTVEQAMHRLVLALMDPDSKLASPAVPTAVAPPEAPVAAAVPDSQPDAPVAVAVEPYIDSILCTTCQDCININSRMFRYNDDKQAFIADAGAGTYAELVKAAEKCPARCIHPGRPRDGDATGTDAMIARAAPFN